MILFDPKSTTELNGKITSIFQDNGFLRVWNVNNFFISLPIFHDFMNPQMKFTKFKFLEKLKILLKSSKINKINLDRFYNSINISRPNERSCRTLLEKLLGFPPPLWPPFFLWQNFFFRIFRKNVEFFFQWNWL